MSENTPFANCESFTDLLNETSVPQTPLFTSQVSFQNIDGTGVEENSPEAAREARRRWSVLEDGVLVSGWLNTSKDTIVGNEQKAGAFWKRVAAYFAASPAVKDLQKREWNNCKQR
uniref:Glutathione S-transferase T3 n=1 Tax=Noccaea caerulescens TaxID=107243 RepID=A0A1J3HZE9_NOCCA